MSVEIAPLRVGDLVNLSFELQPTSLDRLDDGIPSLRHLDAGNYRFIARVLRV